MNPAERQERLVSLSSTDWDLHRKASDDQRRHLEKVREAIKQSLPDLVSNENIITSDGQRLVRVPIRSLELPRFRYKIEGREEGGSGPGRGRGAGNEPGIDYIEVGITIDELAELLFEDLELPNLQDKKSDLVTSPDVRYTDVRKTGPMSSWDKRRTILENLKRNARDGNPRFGGISNEDMRYKTWTETLRMESNAVVFALRDVSGSMGEFEKYITRSVYFWMVRFLKARYTNVVIKFITHHTEAKEVGEDAFFNLGESGGTKVSPAYALALETIKRDFNPDKWNSYIFHFSDGDNWGESDNSACRRLVEQSLQVANLFGYGEIREGGASSSSTLMTELKNIRNPKFVPVVVTKKKDVYPALQRFFPKSGKVAA